MAQPINEEQFPDPINVVRFADKIQDTEESRRGTSKSPVASSYQSQNYVQGVSGWKLNSNGEVEIKGKIPASASAKGKAGTVAISTTHIYVCTALNTWKRVAIATW